MNKLGDTKLSINPLPQYAFTAWLAITRRAVLYVSWTRNNSAWFFMDQAPLYTLRMGKLYIALNTAFGVEPA